MGEQDVPTDSISYTIPQVVSPTGGFPQLSLADYFGLPTVGQVAAGNTISVSALPFRAYNLIVHQWFRDENLVTSPGWGSTGGYGQGSMDDGPDPWSNYSGQFYVAKRHDYFTSCLPFTQKSPNPVAIPLTGTALVKTSSAENWTTASPGISFRNADGSAPTNSLGFTLFGTPSLLREATGAQTVSGTQGLIPSNLYADLSTATSTTVNALRLSFQTQKLLERDARGGTRYTEIVRSHFGVISPDARLQRPEYLGGSKNPINITPVPQTAGTGASGSSTPLGQLAGVGTGVHRAGYRQSFTEHGYVVGLVCARRDQLYQQGLRRLWKRSTRYDFYFPVFAMLGEQSVFNYEIYSDGSANDALTFGYQERWAEYRYHPSFTSAYFRSTNSTPLDAWHLGTKFTSLPVLNGPFVADDTLTVMSRVLAGGAADNDQQFIADFFFDEKAARPMPAYSAPGLIDHF